MAEYTRAIRNIGRRPLSLTFKRDTVRVLPKRTSEFFTQKQWNDGGYALEQATKYVADREAVWVNGLNASDSNIKEVSMDEALKGGDE